MQPSVLSETHDATVLSLSNRFKTDVTCTLYQYSAEAEIHLICA